MTTKSIRSQTIAIAGILQSVYMVDQIARTGEYPPESFNPSINSLFEFDATSVEAVFGGLRGVKLGLNIINDILGGDSKGHNKAVIRYALGLLLLERKLSRDEKLMATIHQRLEHTAMKAEHFTNDVSSTASSIAAIYQDTVSTFKYRIQINGSMQHLQNSANADNIRALLLAGIRSTVMWRQTGGRRWQLVFRRNSTLSMARDLLQAL
ncbi:MAG: high frequency lysogenization protein HflD [Oceanicoccus sp.]